MSAAHEAAQDLREVWRARRRELLLLWSLGVLVLGSYGIARPATDSLFLAEFGKEKLPWVWLAVALSALVVTALLNRLAARAPLTRVFVVTILCTVGVLLVLLSLHGAGMPGSSFLLYVWRDLYVVVLVEVFWSYAACVFELRTARLLYGSFLVAGTLGEFLGTQAVGALTTRVSTTQSLWVLVPIFGVAFAVALLLRRYVALVPAPKPGTKTSFSDTVRLLKNSSYLSWLVLLVVLVQIAVTLIDYEYSGAIKAAFPDTDERTRIIGNVYGAIALAAISLQVLSAPLLRFVGVMPTLFVAPVFLLGCLAVYALVPSLAVMIVTKVASKCFDYSLMRAGKEILYIPLSYEEKTQGKAVVDIFTYRVAKGATSLLLLGLIAVNAGTWVLLITVGLVIAWLLVTAALRARYLARLRAQQVTPVEPASSVAS